MIKRVKGAKRTTGQKGGRGKRERVTSFSLPILFFIFFAVIPYYKLQANILNS